MTISAKLIGAFFAVSLCLFGCEVAEQSWLSNSIPEINWESPATVEPIIQDEILRIERREVIQPHLIRPDGGEGFTAPVWRSGAGDRPMFHGGTEYANRCSCVLLEDSKPLGPKGADNDTIRLAGAGAWNHGAWHSVRFSTSDGTDPRENGRTYSLIKNESVQVQSARVMFDNTAPIQFTIDTPPGSEPFLVEMSNSTSDTPLIFLLRHRDGPALWSITDLASDIAAHSTGSEEAATRLHELVVDWRYHYFPSTPLPPDVPRNPEDLIRAYGFGLCHESAGALVNLFRSVGLEARLRGLGSHVVAEAFFDKSWHMFDPDGNAMIRGPRGKIVSVDDLIEAPEYIRTGIVRRAGASSSISTENLVDIFLQAQNATTNEEGTSRLSPGLRTIDWIAPLVRPGESVSLHYSDPWSFECTQYCWKPFPPQVGNGRIVREIDLELRGSHNFKVTSRYPIVGADLDLTFTPAESSISVQTQIPGLEVNEPSVHGRDGHLFVDLSRSLRGPPRAVREFNVRLSPVGASQRIRVSGRLLTDFQFAPKSHPHVVPGKSIFLAAAVASPSSKSISDGAHAELKLSWIEPDTQLKQ